MPTRKNAELDRQKTKKKTTAEEPFICCVFKFKLCGELEKMCREYSTQEVTVNDETDEEAEYEIIDSNPI